jgi:hypothetical protein
MFQTIAEGRPHGSRRMPAWRGVLTGTDLAGDRVRHVAQPTI